MESLDRLGTLQHGLVTARQATGAGWSRAQLVHAVRRGRLVAVRRGVYRLAGAPCTRRQALLAAVLAAADGAVLSHGTACELWGFPGFPTGLALEAPAIDVLVSGHKVPRLPGVRGHATLHLPASHRGVRERIPVTSPERSLVDSCGLISRRALGSAVNDGLRRRVVSLSRLARTVDEVPVSGRRRIVPMIEQLRERVVGYDPGHSDSEVDLVELLVAAGFPRPQQQIRVVAEGQTSYIDVGWSDLRVGFEYDSLEFHVHAFHTDRERLRRLKRAGWDVWPITSATSKNEILAIATRAFSPTNAP